jgi:hypothetical protein
MTIRFCGACGTEVDETAAFCPSCGRPLGDEPAAAKEPPTWDEGGDEDPDQPTAAWTSPSRRAVEEGEDEPAPVEDRPAEPEPRADEERDPGGPEPPAAKRRSRPTLPSVRIPVTWPVTLSGWLIGLGALLAVVAFFLPWTIAPAAGFFDRWGLISPVNLLLLVALLAIAASVFFSTNVPDFAHRRLAILVVVLIGLGVGLDRIGIGAAGFGAVLFFLGMLSASIGALLLEVGADRPMSGPAG